MYSGYPDWPYILHTFSDIQNKNLDIHSKITYVDIWKHFCCNSEKWLESVDIYRRYRNIKTGVPLFGLLNVLVGCVNQSIDQRKQWQPWRWQVGMRETAIIHQSQMSGTVCHSSCCYCSCWQWYAVVQALRPRLDMLRHGSFLIILRRHNTTATLTQ